MFTGHIIDELIASVERAEERALELELRAIHDQFKDQFNGVLLTANADRELMVGAA